MFHFFVVFFFVFCVLLFLWWVCIESAHREVCISILLKLTLSCKLSSYNSFHSFTLSLLLIIIIFLLCIEISILLFFSFFIWHHFMHHWIRNLNVVLSERRIRLSNTMNFKMVSLYINIHSRHGYLIISRTSAHFLQLTS